MLILAACGGGSGGGSSTTNTPATNLVATSVLSTAPVASCPNGGVTVQGGIDSNGNKILDPSEVTSTQYVCNGSVGASGLNTLVLMTSEPTGANCATGGKKVSAGQDANNNAVLDTSEITTTAYVCNGANGNSGLNSLVSIVPEPAGTFCAYGGNKVNNGLDTNANSVLDPTEITASNYVCNGAPGATGSSIAWVNVTGTSVQATSNTAYLANNDTAPVTITLPTAPVLGDIVQVSGIGKAGWKIAQNAGQSILTQNLVGSYGNSGIPVTALGTIPYTSSMYSITFAHSADLSKLVAANGGQIYTSADSGITWATHSVPAVTAWSSIASSTDGSKLVASGSDSTGSGSIYISSDSGLTWTVSSAPTGMWSSVASSADGSKLVAAQKYGNAFTNGLIYTSVDYGVTWAASSAPVGNWSSVTSSADGNKLVALSTFNNGQIYTSNNSGSIWTMVATATQWSSVTLSANGNKMMGFDANRQLYISSDSGVTWSANVPYSYYSTVFSSADGSKLILLNGSQITVSGDFGMTWTSKTISNSYTSWNSVALSADGSKLLAVPSQPFVSSPPQLYAISPFANPNTTLGISGSLSGTQYNAVDLQCVGNNTFMVRGYAGSLLVQ